MLTTVQDVEAAIGRAADIVERTLSAGSLSLGTASTVANIADNSCTCLCECARLIRALEHLRRHCGVDSVGTFGVPSISKVISACAR